MEIEPMPSDGDTLETGVCVIGAGPAGLVVASTLAAAGRDVILLESGDTQPDAVADALNEGVVIGHPYAGLRATRRRQVGGAAATWNTRWPGGVGAKYAPLDDVDFEPREAFELSGWPLSFAELKPWYERAQATCGLGPFDYDADLWRAPGREVPPGLDDAIVSRIYQFGSRHALLDPMLRGLQGAGNARVVTHSTALQLETDAADRTVTRVRVEGSGRRWWVAARQVVLAGGAVENARMLLASGRTGDGLGNRHGWVGRCFMEHPRDSTLVLLPRSRDAYRRLRFYDVFEAAGHAACGRLGIARERLRGDGLLNASATLLPVLRPAVSLVRRALGPAAAQPLAARLFPRGGHGWSAHPTPGLVFDGLRVLINLEQAPDPDNRIVLGTTRDALGVRRAELHWQWRARDEDSLRRVRDLFATALQRAGLGVVRHGAAALDPNAHHHAGTTRMHPDPRFGVVDAEGRVHGVENLHIAGASTFPTAGYANPALTIVALALRLADRLVRAL